MIVECPKCNHEFEVYEDEDDEIGVPGIGDPLSKELQSQWEEIENKIFETLVDGEWAKRKQ